MQCECFPFIDEASFLSKSTVHGPRSGEATAAVGAAAAFAEVREFVQNSITKFYFGVYEWLNSSLWWWFEINAKDVGDLVVAGTCLVRICRS